MTGNDPRMPRVLEDALSWDGQLSCPSCASALIQRGASLLCQSCNHTWPIVDDVPSFVSDFPYWGEMPHEQMLIVNRLIRERPWQQVLLESDNPDVRRAADMVLNLDRANWHWLTDLCPNSRALDLGAGMGTTAHALAGRFREVVALEPVAERVEFMQCRFAQEGLRNVKVLRSSLWNIPFGPESFDLVSLNGVLEWVATGRPGNPEQLQQAALNKAFELLRPGGYLYVGIENRMPWQYFTGAPDVHCGLPYVTVLPRPIANWYAKRKGQCEGYRNYLYSILGYRRLLKRAGFADVQFYLAVPSYNAPRFYMPVTENVFAYFSRNFNPNRSGRLAAIVHSMFARLRLLKYLQNSFAILGKKAY